MNNWSDEPKPTGSMRVVGHQVSVVEVVGLCQSSRVTSRPWEPPNNPARCLQGKRQLEMPLRPREHRALILQPRESGDTCLFLFPTWFLPHLDARAGLGIETHA